MTLGSTTGPAPGIRSRLRAWWRRRPRPQARPEELPLLQAHGWGGLVALYPDRISIRRIGFLHVVMDILPLHIPRVDSVIFLDTVTAIEVVRPLLLIEVVRFTYAGGPQETAGGYWSAAFADNAVMMNLLDNRKFYRLIEAANVLRRSRAVPGGEVVRR
ncbi:MAG: hypothetical protein IT561_19905 [Alphaproteobacteria bacterium]|nr:hypothetical protein [Alphaproteobacteria bacterium]